MTTDDQGNPILNPAVTTLKQDEEIFVLNTLIETHTFTNGNGIGDKVEGTIVSWLINDKYVPQLQDSKFI